MILKNIQPEKLKLVLFLVFFLMTAALAGLYYFQTLISGKEVFKDIKIDSEASLILNSMQHTSTRNGIKEWTLEASSAKVLKNEAKAILMDISVLFFLKDGDEVVVTAKQGYINTKENDMHLFDNVIVRDGDAILKTDQLHYNKKSHIIYSTDHVTITNHDSALEADTLNIDLNKNTLLLKGNFIGVFAESFDFSPKNRDTK